MAMTPLQLNTAARRRYNAVNDDFWTDVEIYDLIYQACSEMATEGLVIEQVYSTNSVANQQEYSFPTSALNIKRITYDGRKLSYITFREDDILTLLNAATTTTGTVTSYGMWNNIVYLRAIPAEVKIIKVFANIVPQSITATSTLEFPRGFEMSPVNFLLSEMSAKNKNYDGALYYRGLWEKDVKRAARMQRMNKIGDSFQVVKNVDRLLQSDLGNI